MNQKIFWGIFAFLAVFLHFKNLGSTSLWQDEAETAVLARNTVHYGLPRVWDGRNLVSQNMGQDHDSNGIWNYSPWIGIYATAASFALFGESTFTARLPFALFSLATLFFLYNVARLWSRDKRTAALAVWLTLLSVPYILHARQCRYYVLDAFFSLYLLYAYQRCLEDRKIPLWHLPLSAFGLFYSNFLVFFAILGGIAAHFCLFVPRKIQILKRNAMPLAIAALLLLPGCFYFRVLGRAGGENPDWLAARWRNIYYCFRDVDHFVFPALLLFFLPLAWKRLRKQRMPLTVLACGLASLTMAPHYFFRYLIPFIPLCSFLIAEIFWALYDRAKPAAIGILAALIFTNVFCISIWCGYGKLTKTDLTDLLYETTHPINEPVKAAADYLNHNASPDDLLLVSYPDLPFIFYTQLRVIGGRSGFHAVRPEEIRWILLRDDSEKSDWPLDFRDYEKIPLDSPNWPWTNRPDPDIHVFRTVRTTEPAAIYRRF